MNQFFKNIDLLSGINYTVMNILAMNNLPWTEKYRPKKLKDMVQSDELVKLFKNCIDSGDIPHLMLHGPPGTGKTSSILALGREIFKEYFSERIIEFNASDDRGINAVREKIANDAKLFVSDVVSRDGTKIPPYKIIILDEADSMTDEAQNALRVIIEQYSSVTRFCLICNYISKITSAIKSRFSIIYFKKLSKKCMLDRLNIVSEAENMKINEDVLDTIITVSNGDMRCAIMTLQNIKYLYEFKQILSKNMNQMNKKELNLISHINQTNFDSNELTKQDVYNVSATIDMETATNIIEKCLESDSIYHISKLAKEVVSTGYPIDVIMMQINIACCNYNKLDDKKKATIAKYSGKILNRIKEASNEYIQLLDFFSCIYGVNKNITIYSD